MQLHSLSHLSLPSPSDKWEGRTQILCFLQETLQGYDTWEAEGQMCHLQRRLLCSGESEGTIYSVSESWSF